MNTQNHNGDMPDPHENLKARTNRIAGLITRTWAGPLPPEEQAELDAWIGNSPSRKAFINNYSDIESLISIAGAYADFDPEEEWRNLRALHPELGL